VLAFLIGTVGGLSTIIAQLVTPQIRAWNRISIFIAFFAFIAVAVGLDALGRRLGPALVRRAAFAGVLVALLGFGLYNQVTYAHVPPYELEASWAQDRRFVDEIDRRLPEGASVFQLPYLGFPETGRRVDLYENDLLRGYLHSDDLRWSFGATKGRPEDWSDDLVGMPVSTVVDAAAAAGFAGLWIDRLGYADRARALEQELRGRLGAGPLVSESGRQAFFDLRDHRRRLEAEHSAAELAAFRRAVLYPFGFERSGFLPLERRGGRWFAWADSGEAELCIVNATDEQRTAVFEAELDREGGSPADVVVSLPGATAVTYHTPARIRRELSLPPGETTVRFSTSAAEILESRANRWRPHHFRLGPLTVTDAALSGFGR
jgi:phosphoglycerol transferase